MRLRAARESAGMTQRQLAEQLRLHTLSVADWEARRDDPTMAHFILWAYALGLRLAIIDPQGSPALYPIRLDDGETLEQHEMRRLAAALWTRRSAWKMSQAALAAEVGVGRISMQRWENVEVFPRPLFFLAWAASVECGVDLQQQQQPTTRTET
jgi:transcriptional regulator with XRE-family HTH domain